MAGIKKMEEYVFNVKKEDVHKMFHATIGNANNYKYMMLPHCKRHNNIIIILTIIIGSTALFMLNKTYSYDMSLISFCFLMAMVTPLVFNNISLESVIKKQNDYVYDGIIGNELLSGNFDNYKDWYMELTLLMDLEHLGINGFYDDYTALITWLKENNRVAYDKHQDNINNLSNYVTSMLNDEEHDELIIKQAYDTVINNKIDAIVNNLFSIVNDYNSNVNLVNELSYAALEIEEDRKIVKADQIIENSMMSNN